MHILVQIFQEKIILLKVERTNTIENIKKRIQDEVGIPSDHQELFFAGKLLEGTKTLNDYSLRSKSKLLLSRVVCTYCLEKIHLQISSDEVVHNIKEKIYERKGALISQQKLIFEGKELDSFKKIDYYGVGNESTLHLFVKEENIFRLFVTSIDSTITFIIGDENTIQDVKFVIYSKCGVQPVDQELRYNDDVLNNEVKISDIKNNGASCLFFKLSFVNSMFIFVNLLSNKRICLAIKPYFTIYSLKEQIEVREGIPTAQQVLLLAKETLEDSKLLSSYNLSEELTLQLKSGNGSISIFVNIVYTNHVSLNEDSTYPTRCQNLLMNKTCFS